MYLPMTGRFKLAKRVSIIKNTPVIKVNPSAMPKPLASPAIKFNSMIRKGFCNNSTIAFNWLRYKIRFKNAS